jgi:hypothetical protein
MLQRCARLSLTLIASVLSAGAFTACGSLPSAASDVVRYEHKLREGFVRVERIERNAPLNDHPAMIAADALRAALASVQVSGIQLGGDIPVFDDKELSDIARPLATALNKAAPAEDVTFAVLGKHGLFGDRSPTTATTGRVFVRGGQLNVVLGVVQTRYQDVNQPPIALTPGQRAGRVETVWRASSAAARKVAQRDDWLQFDLAGLGELAAAAQTGRAPAGATPGSTPTPATAPAAAAAPGTAAAPAASEDARYQEIKSKLRTLDRLRADGVITEEEYRARRNAILQSL